MPLEAISIIIPVLNEAEQLPKLLEIQPAALRVEIIVVDGGSQDETIEIALAKGVKVIQTEAGRAVQMNAGAAIATHEILLFLHADTQLPDQFDVMVREQLSKPGTVAGAFELNIDADLPGLRWIERGVNWRSRYLQMPYGDQAIFLRRDLFEKLGGFLELPIMEDFELIRTLRHHGTISIVPSAVVTSGRRWQKLGVLRTTLMNQLVILAYFLGVSPRRISHWYRTGLMR
jgi:rSAM/selenodomain-associated transferase 2